MLPFIYATYPPADAGRVRAPVYLVLQAPGTYPPDIAARSRELLPHVFTLGEERNESAAPAGCFLLRLP